MKNLEIADSKVLRHRARLHLSIAEDHLKNGQYLHDVAEALEDLKIAADAFGKKYGPNAKLMRMEKQ